MVKSRTCLLLTWIDPMKVARMLRSHRSLILNWFQAKDQIALGAVEGLNNKAKVTTKKAYGFKSFDSYKTGTISHSWRLA